MAKKLEALIPPHLEDDFSVAGPELRLLPYPGGNMILCYQSYLRVARERKAEGDKCPAWISMRVYWSKGKYR